MKLVKLLIMTITISLVGCASLEAKHQPPPYAFEAWKKPGVTVDKVKADLADCDYIDNVQAIDKNKFIQQTSCMKSKGYTINTKLYNAYNCYGSAPAVCALVR